MVSMLRACVAPALLAASLGAVGAPADDARATERVADELASVRDEGAAARTRPPANAASAAALEKRASNAAAPPPVSTGDPDVRRGRVIQLVLRSGGVRVARVGIALSDGRLGQTIPVRIPGMSPVLCRVSGPGQVELDV